MSGRTHRAREINSPTPSSADLSAEVDIGAIRIDFLRDN